MIRGSQRIMKMCRRGINHLRLFSRELGVLRKGYVTLIRAEIKFEQSRVCVIAQVGKSRSWARVLKQQIRWVTLCTCVLTKAPVCPVALIFLDPDHLNSIFVCRCTLVWSIPISRDVKRKVLPSVRVPWAPISILPFPGPWGRRRPGFYGFEDVGRPDK